MSTGTRDVQKWHPSQLWKLPTIHSSDIFDSSDSSDSSDITVSSDSGDSTDNINSSDSGDITDNCYSSDSGDSNKNFNGSDSGEVKIVTVSVIINYCNGLTLPSWW